MLRISLDDLAKQHGFVLNVGMEADSLPIQKNLVSDGFGYAVLGAQAIIRERDAHQLRAARIVEPSIVRTAVLAASAQRPYTAGMRVVAKALEPLIIEVLDPRR
jgi:LysR family nitrogen assimilation transcriptional regulator